LLKTYYSKDLLTKSYSYQSLEAYAMPEDLSYQGCMDVINQLPTVDIPEIFGFHHNADISKDLKEQNALIS